MSVLARPLEGWNPTTYPHIAVVGEHIARRQRAVDRVLSHLQSTAGILFLIASRGFLAFFQRLILWSFYASWRSGRR